MKILLEMRPALDGHAGIPQEARLLFRALNLLEGVAVDGLIQSSGRVLAKGLPPTDSGQLSMDRQIHRLSRVVVSLQQEATPTWTERVSTALAPRVAATVMIAQHLLGLDQRLGRFDATHFKDFIWRALFARTLHADDFETVTRAAYRVANVPWRVMHECGLATRKLGGAVYPRLDTRDYDFMIAETPYPARVSRGTTMVVRYHDAIPVLMPHTISEKSFHQASHYHALRCNVHSGAHFACVSEATRRDLVSIFPQAEARSVVIPNMVSHHYFDEASVPDRVPEIIRTRLHTGVHLTGVKARHLRPAGGDESPTPLPYLLMVSTIEPRKNHRTLLAAWEQLRAEGHASTKLVIVGMLGWDHKAIVAKFKPWVERGEVFILEDVPAGELRLLYRHALATVCPSFGEGFDFSGIEAMRCGGAVIASDIAVHRDVYGAAAEYFNSYSVADAAAAIERVIGPGAAGRKAELVKLGAGMSARYLPSVVLPMWNEYLHRVQHEAGRPRSPGGPVMPAVSEKT